MYAREESFWWHLGTKRIFGALLERYLSNKKGNFILDAGCGTGGFFGLLIKYGRVYGVDANGKAAAYARKRKIAEVAKAAIERLPFPDGMFDLIICNDVLYHRLVDETAALKEFFRTLKPGGILLIKEPAYNWLAGSHDRLVWTKRRYTRRKLTKRLAANNFEILKSSYLIFFLFPLALLNRLVDFFRSKDFPENLFYSPLSPVLKHFLYLEARLLKYLSFPFGLSVVCVVKK